MKAFKFERRWFLLVVFMLAIPGLMLILLGFIDWLLVQEAARFPVPAEHIRANILSLLAINFMCLGVALAAVWAFAPQFFVQFSAEGIHWLGWRGYRLIKWSEIKRVRSAQYSGNPTIIIKLRFKEISLLQLVFRSPHSVLSYIEQQITLQ